VRVWDVGAGYLNRGSLLGEHRELHGVASILRHRKRGYSRHPETLRWKGFLRALAHRHELLVAEMRLRGYLHLSPLPSAASAARWPDRFVTEPADQFTLLGLKYRGRESGRIRLPRNTQDLWAQHKYSVMARDPDECRATGRRVSRLRRMSGFAELSAELVEILRQRPAHGRIVNAVEHMWGHVADRASPEDRRAAAAAPAAMLATTQALVMKTNERFVGASTALSELAVFL
jgi:pyrimidine dimer DNA glycosylase/uncharacterized protein DUF1722